MTEPLLRIEDLVVDYPVAGGAFRALDSVSLSVDKGTCLAVVGESGCGKSTLAKAIVRLVRPTSGRLCIDGVDIAGLSERKLKPYRTRIQMVFQDPYGSLDPHLSAVDTVAEPLRLHGVRNKRERLARAAALIDRVGLPSTALYRKPAEFSGGQRQRIGIARALASEPELLVCDDGIGITEKLVAAIPEKRGSDYVAIFVRQLGGALTRSVTDGGGATIKIRFPLLLVPAGGTEPLAA